MTGPHVLATAGRVGPGLRPGFAGAGVGAAPGWQAAGVRGCVFMSGECRSLGGWRDTEPNAPPSGAAILGPELQGEQASPEPGREGALGEGAEGAAGRLWAGKGGTSAPSQATQSPASFPRQERKHPGGDRLSSGKDAQGPGAGRRAQLRVPGPGQMQTEPGTRRRRRLGGRASRVGSVAAHKHQLHPSPAG